MTGIRRALELSREATVQTVGGAYLHVRLVPGWDDPVPGTLETLTDSAGGFLGVLTGAVELAREAHRRRKYRKDKRTDWWLVSRVGNDEPAVVRVADLETAEDAAERMLHAAIAAGGRYAPYGPQ
jgi:hypothetical protein